MTLPLDMCCRRAAAGSRMTRAIARCRSARTWTQRVREQNPKNGPLQGSVADGPVQVHPPPCDAGALQHRAPLTAYQWQVPTPALQDRCSSGATATPLQWHRG